MVSIFEGIMSETLQQQIFPLPHTKQNEPGSPPLLQVPGELPGGPC